MRVGCLAQLVNVIAPLVTNDTGVLRQSTYYPYAWALRYARGRVLDLRVESETYPITAAGLQADFARNDQVPFVDVVATLDAQNGQACVLMLNRDLDGEREVVLEWRDVTPTRVLACETLTGPDLKAFNTFEQPRRVVPQRLDAARGRRADDVQAAAAVLHRRPSRRHRAVAWRRSAFQTAAVVYVCKSLHSPSTWDLNPRYDSAWTYRRRQERRSYFGHKVSANSASTARACGACRGGRTARSRKDGAGDDVGPHRRTVSMWSVASLAASSGVFPRSRATM